MEDVVDNDGLHWTLLDLVPTKLGVISVVSGVVGPGGMANRQSNQFLQLFEGVAYGARVDLGEVVLATASQRQVPHEPRATCLLNKTLKVECNRDPGLGTAVFGGVGISPNEPSALKQLWLVEPMADVDDTYRVRNIRSGTFLSLKNGMLSHAR